MAHIDKMVCYFIVVFIIMPLFGLFNVPTCVRWMWFREANTTCWLDTWTPAGAATPEYEAFLPPFGDNKYYSSSQRQVHAIWVLYDISSIYAFFGTQDEVKANQNHNVVVYFNSLYSWTASGSKSWADKWVKCVYAYIGWVI